MGLVFFCVLSRYWFGLNTLSSNSNCTLSKQNDNIILTKCEAEFPCTIIWHSSLHIPIILLYTQINSTKNTTNLDTST